MKKIIIFLFFLTALIGVVISPISAEKNNSFLPSVKFSLGGVIGFISAETEAYVWSGSEYIYGYGGSSYIFNWFSPTFNTMFLLSSDNKLCFGFGGNITIGLFGLFFTKENFTHEGPLTGGTLAAYGIIGYNYFILHIGYDFGSGSIYFSPNYMIHRHLMIGIQLSPFADINRGLYSYLGMPSKKLARPPETYFEDTFYQIGLSIQYVF